MSLTVQPNWSICHRLFWEASFDEFYRTEPSLHRLDGLNLERRRVVTALFAAWLDLDSVFTPFATRQQLGIT
eukprot:226965-Pelagomonas_calceolata.AAC.1